MGKDGFGKTCCELQRGFGRTWQADGIRRYCGEAIVVFTDSSFKELADLLAYDEDLTGESENELLMDVTNIQVTRLSPTPRSTTQ